MLSRSQPYEGFHRSVKQHNNIPSIGSAQPCTVLRRSVERMSSTLACHYQLLVGDSCPESPGVVRALRLPRYQVTYGTTAPTYHSIRSRASVLVTVAVPRLLLARITNIPARGVDASGHNAFTVLTRRASGKVTAACTGIHSHFHYIEVRRVRRRFM